MAKKKQETNLIIEELENSRRSSTLLKEHYERHKGQLSRSELVVADYFIALPLDELIFRSAEQIAAETGTSDATVIRAARRLGFSGLPELKRISHRAMAMVAPATERLAHRFRATGSDFKLISEQMFTAAHELLDSTREKLDPEALAKSIAILENADTVWCVGIGRSEVEAKHCAIALSRIGLRTRAIGTSGFSLANELIGLRPADVVIMFHTARELAELKLVIDQHRSIGCQMILISGVQLSDKYRADVSAVLTCVGTASGLASWSIGAIIVSDILAYGVAVRNQQRALDTKERLADIRSHVLR